MSFSSIYGADVAPTQPSGRDSQLLGPSDNSDTGSDALGTNEANFGDSDAAGTGERASAGPAEARESADILPDHVVRVSEREDSSVEESDAQDFTDLDDSEPGEETD